MKTPMVPASATRLVSRLALQSLLALATVASARAAERSPITHVVARGETLSGIAARYGVSVASMRSWNDLDDDRIVAGRRLVILPDDDDPWYVVGRGDTLSEVALRHHVSVDGLRRWNGLTSDRITVGQKLRVVPPERAVIMPARTAPPTPRTVRTVRRNPTPSRAHPTSDDLNPVPAPPREIKDLGQSDPEANGHAPPPAAPDTRAANGEERVEPMMHTVVRGETLWGIASHHGVTIADLRRLNDLRGDRIRPGQELVVRPELGNGAPQTIQLDPSAIDWSALTVGIPGAGQIESGNGPYYARAPRAQRQRSRTYKEESRKPPRDTFKQAKPLFDAFAAKVSALGRVSRRLEGWHIVLDPGHGGIDPGAITRVLDGRGDPVYVVEDEYVYDIALRMYVLLRLHGADVTMTLLSPNHLIRRSEPATRTFVHERNEVYNSEPINRRNRPTDWPKGGQEGLDARIEIARGAFAGAPRAHTLFLSLHADSSPNTPMVPMVLYYDGRHGSDTDSRRFAEELRPALGSNAIVKGQGLGVLRTNPAAAKVLVEFRNVAYAPHAWALRFEDLRQQDAERVVNGILDYAARR